MVLIILILGLFCDSQKQSVTKKVTSNIERRDHSPETITLQTMEVDIKVN